MKVIFNLPNGYKAEIESARAENDFDGWIDRKFGAKIRELITENEFTIVSGDDSFVVDFTYGDDASAFTRLIGGRIID
jgi:hypothetical protein